MSSFTTDEIYRELLRVSSVRHPAVASVCRHFAYMHLPEGMLRDISHSFCTAAVNLLEVIPYDDPQLTIGLQKLLEAKDAFVRAAVPRGDRA